MAQSGKTAVEVKREIKAEEQEERRRENAEKIKALSTPLEAQGLFQTIVIDPPWDHGDEGDINQFGRTKPEYASPKRKDDTERSGSVSASSTHSRTRSVSSALTTGSTFLLKRYITSSLYRRVVRMMQRI